MQYQKTVEIPFSHLLKHTENESLLPPFTLEEMALLREKMKTELEPQPFVVVQENTETYTILDGNNRYDVLSEMGFNGYIPCIVKKMDLAEQRTYIENNALARRNLSKEDKIKIAQRQVARGISQATVSKTLGMSQAWVSEQTNTIKEARKEVETQAIETLRDAGVTQKETANIVGTSRRTVQNIDEEQKRKIISSDNFAPSPAIAKPLPETGTFRMSPETGTFRMSPEIAKTQVKAMLSEEEILKAAKEIKQEKSKAKIDERKALIEQQNKAIESGDLPELEGLFDVIVIDPPWPYGREYNPETSRIANPYPEMSLEQISDIKLPMKDNGIIFLWTTHQFLPYAFELAKQWGEYKATLVWDKVKMGVGAWFRMQCEFCLVIVKGQAIWWNNTTERDIITEARREHSRKPEAFYELVNKLCPGCRKLDYFSRAKREGWESFGNDIERFNNVE